MGYGCKTSAADEEREYIRAMQAKHGDAGGSSNSWGKSGADPAGFFENDRKDFPDGSVRGYVFTCAGGFITGKRHKTFGVVTLAQASS